MIEVRIRRPCREPEPRGVPGTGSGVRCPDCHAHSYRKDGMITHDQVEEWVYIDELKMILKDEQ